MVSITPHPTEHRVASALSLLSLFLYSPLPPACSSANAPARALFQQFMLLTARCRVPVRHGGLEMLSPPPPSTVTSKIFHKLDWDWQFRIWKWGWGGGGSGGVLRRRGRRCVSNSMRGSPDVYVGQRTIGRYVTGKVKGNTRGRRLRAFGRGEDETQIQVYLDRDSSGGGLEYVD